MYKIIEMRLGPEIVVCFICNTEQVSEMIKYAGAYDGSAIDIIKAIENKFDCRVSNTEYVDPFGWDNEEDERTVEVTLEFECTELRSYTITETVADMIIEIMEKE